MEKIKVGNNIFLFFLMIGIAFVLGANIVMRFVFNLPISWSNTISRYIYIYIVLLGTAVSYMEGQHARIEFIYDALSERLKLVSDIFHIIVMTIISLVLFIIGIKHAIGMWPVHAPVIPWFSVGIVYLSIPICAVVIFIYLIQRILHMKFRG